MFYKALEISGLPFSFLFFFPFLFFYFSLWFYGHGSVKFDFIGGKRRKCPETVMVGTSLLALTGFLGNSMNAETSQQKKMKFCLILVKGFLSFCDMDEMNLA